MNRKRKDSDACIKCTNHNSTVLFSLSQQHNVVPHSTSIIPRYVSEKVKQIVKQLIQNQKFSDDIISRVLTSMHFFLAQEPACDRSKYKGKRI